MNFLANPMSREQKLQNLPKMQNFTKSMQVILENIQNQNKKSKPSCNRSYGRLYNTITQKYHCHNNWFIPILRINASLQL